MKRKQYNHKTYRFFKNSNKIARDVITPDPLEKLKSYGVVGQIVNIAGNEVLNKPIHKLSYNLTARFYDPKKHKPYRGSIIYSIFKYIVCGASFVVFSAIFAMILSF